MLVVDLGKWMNKILIDWGIDPVVADRFDETIMALLMIVIAIVLNYLCSRWMWPEQNLVLPLRQGVFPDEHQKGICTRGR